MNQLSFRIVIPARFASSRFPGKALAELGGRPLISHVYARAVAADAEQVVIATDDRRIAEAAEDFGAQVSMTDTGHCSGTDRIAEVAESLGWGDTDIVVNLQGDAPFIPPASIHQVAALLHSHPNAGMATLCTPIQSRNEYLDSHVVKVVGDQSGRALYFSRAPIPATAHGLDSEPNFAHAFRHLGLYAYRVGALRALAASSPCYLEELEKLEQLRALWLGIEIRLGVVEEEQGPDVDTPEDLEAAARFLEKQ